MKNLNYEEVVKLLGYKEVKGLPFALCTISISSYGKLLNSGMVDSSMAYQRDLKSAWLKPEFRGKVADSILQGLSIGVLHAVLCEDGTLELIDGKQRSNFISLTLDGSGAFSGIEIDDSLNKSFLEWDSSSRKSFNNYPLVLMVFKGLDDTMRRLQFERLNSGVSLSGYEKKRSGIVDGICSNKKVTEGINTLLNAWSFIPVKTPHARLIAEEVYLQALSYAVANNCNWSGAEVVESLKRFALDGQAIEAGAEFINKNILELHSFFASVSPDDWRRFRWMGKKSTLASLILVDPGRGGYSVANFGGFLSDFVCSPDSDQQRFKDSVRSASASPEAVKTRLDILGRVQLGRFTKEAKSTKAVNSQAKKKSLSPADYILTLPFREAWGDVVADKLKNIQACFDFAEGHYPGRCVDFKGRKEEDGALTFSFIDGNKEVHINTLAEALEYEDSIILLKKVAKEEKKAKKEAEALEKEEVEA